MTKNEKKEITKSAVQHWVMRERENNLKNKITFWLAWKLPRRLVCQCAYRVLAHATSGKYENTGVPRLTAIDAITRWGHK